MVVVWPVAPRCGLGRGASFMEGHMEEMTAWIKKPINADPNENKVYKHSPTETWKTNQRTEFWRPAMESEVFGAENQILYAKDSDDLRQMLEESDPAPVGFRYYVTGVNRRESLECKPRVYRLKYPLLLGSFGGAAEEECNNCRFEVARLVMDDGNVFLTEQQVYALFPDFVTRSGKNGRNHSSAAISCSCVLQPPDALQGLWRVSRNEKLAKSLRTKHKRQEVERSKKDKEYLEAQRKDAERADNLRKIKQVVKSQHDSLFALLCVMSSGFFREANGTLHFNTIPTGAQGLTVVATSVREVLEDARLLRKRPADALMSALTDGSGSPHAVVTRELLMNYRTLLKSWRAPEKYVDIMYVSVVGQMKEEIDQLPADDMRKMHQERVELVGDNMRYVYKEIGKLARSVLPRLAKHDAKMRRKAAALLRRAKKKLQAAES